MDDNLFMMMIFLKGVYGGGVIAEKVADRSKITQKRENLGEGK
jgi:hypothetical protein